MLGVPARMQRSVVAAPCRSAQPRNSAAPAAYLNQALHPSGDLVLENGALTRRGLVNAVVRQQTQFNPEANMVHLVEMSINEFHGLPQLLVPRTVGNT